MKRDCRDDDIIRTKFSLISVTKKQQIKKIIIFLLFTFIDTLLKGNNYNSIVLKANVINTSQHQLACLKTPGTCKLLTECSQT